MEEAARGGRKDRLGEARGVSLKNHMVGAWALVVGCLFTAADGRLVAKDQDFQPQPMRFEWHTDSAKGDCGQRCNRWISATGSITEGTVGEFQAFAEKFDLHGATLIIDSEGGSV